MIGKERNKSGQVENLESLRSLTDYEEGKMTIDDNLAYLGKLNNTKGSKLSIEQTIKEQRKPENRDKFLGKVLNPEGRKLDDGKFDEWTSEKNIAFMLGAIEARKQFKLVTPVSHYSRTDYVTGTKYEILMLEDNGYTFSVNADGTMNCTPPEHKIDSPVVIDYWKYGNTKEAKDRLSEIFQDRGEHYKERPWQRQYTPAASSESWRKRADNEKEKNSTRPVQNKREEIYQPPSLRRNQTSNNRFSDQGKYSTSTDSWRRREDPQSDVKRKCGPSRG